MKFDTKNEGTWFWFNEDDELQGGLCLRVCTKADIDRITRLSSQVKREYKRGSRFEFTVTDEAKADKLLWDFCIVDWLKVEVDGTELECTRENKVILMNSCNAFVDFFSDRIERLTNVNAEAAKAEEKN